MAFEAQPRHAVVDAEELDVAAVGLHVGAHGGERLAHPRLEVDRVEVVDQQQAGHDAVLDKPLVDLLAGRAGLVERRDHALQPVAVELHDRADEILGDLLPWPVGHGLERLGELLHASQVALGVDRGGHQQRPVGRCTTLRTRPAPVYMCTPHGRHGSNERTARMMSTPLKFSGPFSSKMGVFWTASSYGPGVP